jgi:hypothetical protein
MIDQPVIRATHRNRSGNQEIAAWKCHDKSRKPWPGIFPKVSLPAENQAENIEESSPGAFVGFQQIAQYRIAFIPIEQL